MIRGHGQVFRRVFEPIAQIGDIVALRNTDGFVTDKAETPFYVVTSVGSSGHALQTKGVIGFWCATAAFGAPYKGDTALQAGVNTNVAIPAGGQATLGGAASLQLVTRQLMQTRFLVRALPDSGGNFVATPEDFDVIINSPPASRNWGTQAVPGVLNARFQDSDPGDNIPAPIQGQSQLRFLGNQIHPFDSAYRTEMFLYSTLGGSVSVVNNGAGSASAGAIGLEIAGFPMNLFPLPVDKGTVEDWMLGYIVTRPTTLNLDDVIPIPIASQSAPKSTGA